MLQHHLTELDLMWFLPLVLISACMLVLWSWVLLGVTVVGRLAWIALLVLSGLAYPVAARGLVPCGPAP